MSTDRSRNAETEESSRINEIRDWFTKHRKRSVSVILGAQIDEQSGGDDE